MASNLRTIQFKRNQNAWASAELAKQTITNMTSSLANGEMVLGTYTDSKAVNGIAAVAAFKVNNQIFFVDNQAILNKLGILHDGSEDANASNDSIIKKIAASDELIGNIIEAAGLNADGTYSPVPSDPFTSGATSLKEATTSLSVELSAVEDFIGMSGTTPGGSIVERVDELTEEMEEVSGNVNTISGDVITINNNISTISGNVNTISGNVNTISGKVETLEDNLEIVSGNVNTVSGNVNTLSGKSITTIEDTSSIDLTKSDADDGTKKIKADLKISDVTGNVITLKTDGVYTQVDYNSATNSLVVNGVEKPLNAGSIVDSISYDSTTEKLIITYHTTTSTAPQTVEVNMKDLIEEYVYPAKDANHNVGFTVTRNVSGATEIQADVNLIDCGEY